MHKIVYTYKHDIFLPNKFMQTVSDKTPFAIPTVLIKVIVPKNNQNSGDVITSIFLISSFDVVPGIINSKLVMKSKIIEVPMYTERRHLYLSVMAPTIGLVNTPGIGCSMKIKPTMKAEYPRCLEIKGINGENGA